MIYIGTRVLYLLFDGFPVARFRDLPGSSPHPPWQARLESLSQDKSVEPKFQTHDTVRGCGYRGAGCVRVLLCLYVG